MPSSRRDCSAVAVVAAAAIATSAGYWQRRTNQTCQVRHHHLVVGVLLPTVLGANEIVAIARDEKTTLVQGKVWKEHLVVIAVPKVVVLPRVVTLVVAAAVPFDGVVDSRFGEEQIAAARLETVVADDAAVVAVDESSQCSDDAGTAAVVEFVGG